MKQLRSILVCLFLIMALSTNALAAPLSQTSIIHYVKSTPTGLKNCTSWDNACGLQAALDKAQSGDKIYVAAGTYLPSKRTSDNMRSATFQLIPGVAIFGGFPATGGEMADRDWAANVTTLSGDIGTLGVISDNSYHVVTGSGVTATTILDGFTISDGNANRAVGGGGMYNTENSSPTLSNLIFSDNSAFEGGGGIYNTNNSSPVLSNVSFISNSTEYDGGGILNEVNSNPILTNVTFNGNLAMLGGGIHNDNSNPFLTNVTFSGNLADNNGGGMYNYGSNPSLTDVTFSDNTANRGGGMYNGVSSPTLTDVRFSSNSADNGGGMYHMGGNPALTNVTFSDNSADNGGGMYNMGGNPTLTNVSFNGNSANRGGGMFNTSSNPSLNNVTFSANSAGGNGGGILNESSSPTLTNVTFSGNIANDRGGGLADSDRSRSRLTNVTFTGNQASTSSIGGAILLGGDGSILSNVIVWGNTPSENQVGYYYPTAYANITYSIIEGWTLGGTGNRKTNPSLGPLADNGGFTQTHALGTESSAIGAGDPTKCPATDQRGHLRLIDGSGNASTSCDIGAYELGYSINVGIEGSGEVALPPNRADFFDGETVTLTAISDPGWTFAGWSGAASVTDNPLNITMVGDANLTATFTRDEYTLTIVPEGSGTVDKSTDQDTFHYGETVTLTANPVPDWSFTGWGGGATGTENPLVLTFDGNKTITARFEQSIFRYFLVPIFK